MNPATRPGMTRQVALGATLAALVAVVASGVLALGLIRNAYDGQSRETLHRDAVLVSAVDFRAGAAALKPRGQGVLQLLRASGVAVVRVNANGKVDGRIAMEPGDVVKDQLPARFALDPEDVANAARGDAFTGTRRISGRRFLVDSQPISSGDGSVVLLQRSSAARAVTTGVLRKLAIALLIGLAAAAGVGVVLARRLTEPLVRAARGAHRLAAGERAVRLDEEGPAEVAELAHGLNSLAAALAASEGRQREFLLSISHELRTPLTGIAGFAEALADGVASGEEATVAGATIQAEAARMQRLVSDLLDLARLGADDFRLDFAMVDLTTLLRDAATVWSQRCAAVGVQHLVELPNQPVWVQTDPGRMRQIVDGLAENALRVTPEGRPIIFALKPDATGRAAVVEVRDGGPGLKPEDLAVAFDRSVLYERYRGVRRVGTGLGLALVDGLVRRLGGYARASHAPEGGACFSVTLPRAA
jgi:two-component system sensor histidine kinase BaeS